MFGLSFGEIVMLLIVGIVVVGPRNLPKMMRTVGQWVTRIRRMATDLRSQSGIDELIRIEGLEREVAELRALTRLNVVDTLITPAMTGAASTAATAAPRPAQTPGQSYEPLREREYPSVGCDAYDALPDDAVPYPPPAALARPVEPIEPTEPPTLAGPGATNEGESAQASTNEPAGVTPAPDRGMLAEKPTS